MSEVSVYVILVVMILLNPADRNGPDSVEILAADNKPLHFQTLDTCYKYVGKNLSELVYYAMENFKPKPALVRGIVCVEREITEI
jgi:hypothetical protein